MMVALGVCSKCAYLTPGAARLTAPSGSPKARRHDRCKSLLLPDRDGRRHQMASAFRHVLRASNLAIKLNPALTEGGRHEKSASRHWPTVRSAWLRPRSGSLRAPVIGPAGQVKASGFLL